METALAHKPQPEGILLALTNLPGSFTNHYFNLRFFTDGILNWDQHRVCLTLASDTPVCVDALIHMNSVRKCS